MNKKTSNKKKSLWVVALAIVVGLLGWAYVGTSAGAAPMPEPRAASAAPAANSVGTEQIKKDGVTAADLAPNSVYQTRIQQATQDYLRTPRPLSVWSSSLNNNIVTEAHLHPAVRAKLNAVDTVAKVNTLQTTLPKVGGPFLQRAKLLGKFTLTRGEWDVNVHMKADRLNIGSADYVTPTTDTYPTLALRVGQTATEFGEEVATIAGAPISKAGRNELQLGDAQTYTVTEDSVEVEIYGFAYNEDTSDFGSDDSAATAGKPQFTISAKVSARLSR